MRPSQHRDRGAQHQCCDCSDERFANPQPPRVHHGPPGDNDHAETNGMLSLYAERMPPGQEQ